MIKVPDDSLLRYYPKYIEEDIISQSDTARRLKYSIIVLYPTYYKQILGLRTRLFDKKTDSYNHRTIKEVVSDMCKFLNVYQIKQAIKVTNYAYITRVIGDTTHKINVGEINDGGIE